MAVSLTTLVAFDGTTQGESPDNGVVIDADGNLFGTTRNGGSSDLGTVFEVPSTTSGYGSLVVLAAFNRFTGDTPHGPLLFDRAGDILGVNDGGATGDFNGSLYTIPKITGGYGTLTVARGFPDQPGDPVGPNGITADVDGNLFGTTSGGGADGYGTVFEIPKTMTGTGYGPVVTLATFDSNATGGAPFSTVLIDADGNLFGTTSGNGPGHQGTVFELPKVGGAYGPLAVIGSFGGANGGEPEGSLIADAAGDLFGTTSTGGDTFVDNGGFAGYGTVFEIVKDATGYGQIVTLASFHGVDGSDPRAGLLMDAAGNLFGTTATGGAGGDGTVFKIAKTSDGYGRLTTLFSFTGQNGRSPSVTLVADRAGHLFGTTNGGGNGPDDGYGTVFELSGTGYVACYVRGTQIQTAVGETAVEDLRIGDSVVTAAGARRRIRWIGTRSYLGRFANGNPDVLPIRFAAGSLGEGVPRRDLHVSPEHAMYLDGVLVPARHLLNGATITQAHRVDRVDYVHVELDSHDIILAEGAPSETFVDDGSRAMFHNAREHAALYPEEAYLPSVYCAPRCEEGFVLERVRARLARLAGLPVAAALPAGPLTGAVERVDGARVTGWALDTHHPEVPVCLDVLVSGEVVAQVLAEQERPDLRQTSPGGGRHGFTVNLPARPAGEVTVRRSADGVPLPAPRRSAPPPPRAA